MSSLYEAVLSSSSSARDCLSYFLFLMGSSWALSVGVERKEEVAPWTTDKKQVSPYALSLQQLKNGV